MTPETINTTIEFDAAAWMAEVEAIGAKIYWSYDGIQLQYPVNDGTLGIVAAWNILHREQVAKDPDKRMLRAHLEEYRFDCFVPGMGRVVGEDGESTAPKITDLSFVTDSKDDRCFWDVTPDEDDAYGQGELLAVEWLKYERQQEPTAINLLSLIIGDMDTSWSVGGFPQEGTIGRVEVGFFHALGLEAVYGRGTAQRWHKQSRIAMAEYREKEQRERSGRARHAANARWAKVRKVPA